MIAYCKGSEMLGISRAPLPMLLLLDWVKEGRSRPGKIAFVNEISWIRKRAGNFVRLVILESPCYPGTTNQASSCKDVSFFSFFLNSNSENHL